MAWVTVALSILALVGQRLERGQHDEVPVDLEVAAQRPRASLRPKPSVPSVT